MQYETDNDEVIVDFKKVFKIIDYRKSLITKVFLTFMLIFIVLYFISPKVYKTDADLYVKKTNNTNIAEINPYVIESMSNLAGGVAGMLTGGMAGLQNEIEIMKSPLVMDNVIKENNLRYNKGNKKGELISTRDFLKNNLSIKNEKGSNIISIKYKSLSAKQSYNVVNSIINNYQKVSEEFNLRKAISDKNLLQVSYEETNKDLNKKLSLLEHAPALPETAMSSLGPLAALRGHARSASGAIGSIQSQIVKGKKSEISLEQDVEKLKFVKEKLEWSKLIEQMSKDKSNVIILKAPEIKRDFEQSSPKLWLNLLLGAIFGLIASIITVIFAEIKDDKLTYSNLGNNVLYDVENNLDDLKALLLTKSKNNILFVTFGGFKTDLFKKLDGFTNIKSIAAGLSPQQINEISNSDNIIFAGKIGESPKKLYYQMKTICTEAQKRLYAEII